MKITKSGSPLPYLDTSKMVGKFYQRFIYLGKVFISNIEDNFTETFDDNQLHSVDFQYEDDSDGVERLTLVGWTNHTQEREMARACFDIDRYSVGDVDTTIDEEKLSKIMVK